MIVNTANLRRCRCGKLYEVFELFFGDQSRCGACKSELIDEYNRQNNQEHPNLIDLQNAFSRRMGK